MELNLLHLYPDCMSLYGEYANVAVLKRHLEALGVSVTVKGVSLDDTPDFSAADFIYMGAGTERTQKAALTALEGKGAELKAALDRGAVVLFTGSAMETLGASVTDTAGKVWPGLGLAEFATVETDKRSPEDVIAHSTLWDSPVVGFMNKCSRTSGVSTPLFDRLSLGFGNEAEKGADTVNLHFLYGKEMILLRFFKVKHLCFYGIGCTVFLLDRNRDTVTEKSILFLIDLHERSGGSIRAQRLNGSGAILLCHPLVILK